MKLSIGPIQYHWQRQDVFDFYEQVATGPAEIVYLGEVVCSKRRLLKPDDWIAIGRELNSSGKQVVLSSLTLLESAAELGALKRLCANGEFAVEANDVSAVQILSGAGVEFVTGPAVNLYNGRSLSVMARKGMRRWVLPVELGLETLADLQALKPEGVETEVLAFGRLPLAWSARCFTARSCDLPKDDCQFKCGEDPDGRLLNTREDEEFLNLNGIQVQSARTHQALECLPRLESLGVDVLRLSPQSRHFERVVNMFDAARDGAETAGFLDELATLVPAGLCNGYLIGEAGMDYGSAKVA